MTDLNNKRDAARDAVEFKPCPTCDTVYGHIRCKRDLAAGAAGGGWTAIRSVEDLPKADGTYLVSVKDERATYTVKPHETRVITANFVVNDEIFTSGWLFNYEAWQPIPAPFTPPVQVEPVTGETK